MKHLKTMYFVIEDSSSYSLAVSILPPAFATIPRSQVFGHVVVINDLNAHYPPEEAPIANALVVDNTWMSVHEFNQMYEEVDTPVRISLTEVVKSS